VHPGSAPANDVLKMAVRPLLELAVLMAIGAAIAAELARVMAAAIASRVLRVFNISNPPMTFMNLFLAEPQLRWLPQESAENFPTSLLLVQA
jgi:hypothetical protein